MPIPARGAITDDKGNFTIAGLAGGEVRVDRGSSELRRTPRLVVNAPPGANARKTLYAAALSRVSGSVIDEGSRAVAGVSINARRVGGDMLFDAILGVHAVARDHRAERPVCSANCRRGERSARRNEDRIAGGAFRNHSRRAGSRTTDIVITLPRGVALTGRVITRDAKPVAGAAVTATEPGAGGVRDAEGVRTKGDGTFVLRVREGAYDVTVTAAGFAPRTLRAQVSASAPPP